MYLKITLPRNDSKQDRDQEKEIVIEYVVAQIANYIDAPIPKSSLIRITEELNFSLLNGKKILPGIAHANIEIELCELIRGISYLDQDDNKKRFTGVLALFDLCYGHDFQWLCDKNDDMSIYSHDHGLYLPPNSGWFTTESLISAVDEPHPLPLDIPGLQAEDLENCAILVENLSREMILSVLNSVPSSWKVTNEELETLGWFIESRRSAVAVRLRNMVKGAVIQ